MSDHDSTHATAAAHGGHDEHGHAADTLGPIDWRMWGVGLLGVLAGLVVVAGFIVSTKFAFGA
jgi:hypothetical protein